MKRDDDGSRIVDDDSAVLPFKEAFVVEDYAKSWIWKRVRDLDIEDAYPTLAELFAELRADWELACLFACVPPESAPAEPKNADFAVKWTERPKT